jgi:hypothetical protein
VKVTSISILNIAPPAAPDLRFFHGGPLRCLTHHDLNNLYFGIEQQALNTELRFQMSPL